MPYDKICFTSTVWVCLHYFMYTLFFIREIQFGDKVCRISLSYIVAFGLWGTLFFCWFESGRTSSCSNQSWGTMVRQKGRCFWKGTRFEDHKGVIHIFLYSVYHIAFYWTPNLVVGVLLTSLNLCFYNCVRLHFLILTFLFYNCSILNKLTPEKFDLLKGQLIDAGITSADILKVLPCLLYLSNGLLFICFSFCY